MIRGDSTVSDDTPTLTLIHGLGATPGVWHDTIDAIEWPGPVVAPSLPGHGDAPWSDDYTVPALAAAVSATVSQAAVRGSTDTRPTLIVGHSLGGAVGIELASGRYGVPVAGVVGLGIKATWTDDDVARMAAVAERGIRWFPTRDEAIARFLRLAGLDGVIDADHPVLDGAVVDGDHPAIDGSTKEGTTDGPWRVAQDPATFAQRPVDLPALLAAADCPVWLGAGEHDPMATERELRAVTDRPRIAAGRGHNVHVEDPRWVAGLVAELVAAAGDAGR